MNIDKIMPHKRRTRTARPVVVRPYEAECVKLHNEGLKTKKIVRKIGASANHVRYLLKASRTNPARFGGISAISKVREPSGDRRRVCIQWLNEGRSKEEIASVLGIEVSTVTQWKYHSRSHPEMFGGLSAGPVRIRAIPAKATEAIRLCIEGKLPEEVAKAVDVPLTTINGWRSQSREHPEKFGGLSAPFVASFQVRRDKREKALAMLDTGSNPFVVARECGLSLTTINNFIKKNFSAELSPADTVPAKPQSPRAKAMQMFADGVDPEDVAQACNASFALIAAWQAQSRSALKAADV